MILLGVIFVLALVRRFYFQRWFRKKHQIEAPKFLQQIFSFIAFTVAVYVPSLVRGERIAPGQPPVENQWLGGPRTGTAELKGPETVDAEAGGASGRW